MDDSNKQMNEIKKNCKNLSFTIIEEGKEKQITIHKFLNLISEIKDNTMKLFEKQAIVSSEETVERMKTLVKFKGTNYEELFNLIDKEERLIVLILNHQMTYDESLKNKAIIKYYKRMKEHPVLKILGVNELLNYLSFREGSGIDMEQYPLSLICFLLEKPIETEEGQSTLSEECFGLLANLLAKHDYDYMCIEDLFQEKVSLTRQLEFFQDQKALLETLDNYVSKLENALRYLLGCYRIIFETRKESLTLQIGSYSYTLDYYQIHFDF